MKRGAPTPEGGSAHDSLSDPIRLLHKVLSLPRKVPPGESDFP